MLMILQSEINHNEMVWSRMKLALLVNCLFHLDFGNMGWKTTNQLNENDELDRNTFNITQSLGFPVMIFKGFHMRVCGRHFFIHQQNLKDINYLFLDTFLRYTYKKRKTDFELHITSIGNIKKFETYNINANEQSQNTYELRGIMAILKAVFNLSKR